jgi:hypothetical protein
MQRKQSRTSVARRDAEEQRRGGSGAKEALHAETRRSRNAERLARAEK